MTRSVVILTAMQLEADPFIELLEGAESVEAPASGIHAVRGALDRRDLVVARTGVGLVAAATATAWASSAFNPQAIISAGTAGGLPRDISIGDVAVSEASTYGTADATEFGYERGQVPGQPVRFNAADELLEAARDAAQQHWRFGRILSGDTFVTAKNVADTREAFPDAVATDMESCAIAQTASAFSIPWLSVRGISDLCGPEAGQDFHMDAAEAAERSRDAVVAILSRLPAPRQ
ncbi:MAG TPA: 5'-methylthioadenosine/S-adenosylhomocysteine nucleosidase [Candidatus Agrococcus pullicola]|uniref:adenosylhomocysteine nucleosidase n=1 Tax=Candidatus Agrococcus pullicola TaxID=2838429 RepID=A0A9D1YW87_9MICO|nr:5'-methylthioadenosine/S-adenosylhomocysteine nucleosidase [Candidatus Agrococcus pullicola]